MEKHYLIVCQEDISPLLEGPLDPDDLVAKAKEMFQGPLDYDSGDHLYWLIVDDQGIPQITGFTEEFVEAAINEVYGEDDEEWGDE